MADEKLLSALNGYLRSGNTPEQTKNKLIRDGYSDQDVTGAFAVHSLSQLPIGQNPGTQWKEMTTKNQQKTGVLSKIILLLILVLIGLFGAKQYGYNLPFVPDVALSKELDSKYSLEALSPFFHQFTSEAMLATTSPTYTKNDPNARGSANSQ